MHGLFAYFLTFLSSLFTPHAPHFVSPAGGQLSLSGDVAVELRLPRRANPSSLVVTLDGVDVTDLFTVERRRAKGSVPSPAGEHELVATVKVRRKGLREARVGYETIDVEDPDCEILNAMECALPYPSSRFLSRANTPTGVRLAIPQVALPTVNGPPIPVDMLNELDGFSPTVQILMGFPEGVDLVASGLSRLLPPCLGAPGEDPECIPDTDTPWEGVRSYDDRSLDPEHPTVLLRWSRDDGGDGDKDGDKDKDRDRGGRSGGERVLHWTEPDGRLIFPDRQAFILRPAESLIPGERYIVAVRRLVARDGTEIEAEAPFAALRDRRPTDIPQLRERRGRFEKIFRELRRAGIDRKDLVLAFDFTVQSEHQLTHQMLTMRDTAFEWLAKQEQPTFQVAGVRDRGDCSDPSQIVWKEVDGTFQSPLFLEEAPTPDNVPQHSVDGNDRPVMNGTMDAPFDISIPCLLHPDNGDPSAEVYTILLGHGIFGTGRGMVRGIPTGFGGALDAYDGSPAPGGGTRTTRRWNYIAGATNWTGWSGFGSGERAGLWIAGRIIGMGASQLHNFRAFPDRHRQGQSNTLVLSRMMTTGAFNSHPEFQYADGTGIFPVRAPQYYYGISMGGVQGLFHAAISQDIEKFGIDVGSMNFSFLLQRSTQFPTFELLLTTVGLFDPLDQQIGLTMVNELWVSADPAGYMTRVTDPDNLLPGNDFPKKLYLSPAWLDYQVSNHGTEATARTLGVASGPGSLQKELVGIPDAAPGAALDSALVMWDTGLHDILDPAGEPFIPPLANRVVPSQAGDPHGARPSIPAGIQTLLQWLQPGGKIENFCDDDGVCNASQPWECEAEIDAGGNPLDGCP